MKLSQKANYPYSNLQVQQDNIQVAQSPKN